MSVVSTTELGDILGLAVTPSLIELLGIEPAPKPEGKKRGTFWRKSDVPEIMRKLGHHLIKRADTASAKLDDEDPAAGL